MALKSLTDKIKENQVERASNVVCTIGSLGYLPQLNAFTNSLLENHANCKLVMVLVDIDFEYEVIIKNVRILSARNILGSKFDELTSRYDIVEFATCLKPILIQKLLLEGNQNVAYIDPDVMFFSNLNDIFDKSSRSNILLTPHRLVPSNNSDSIIQDSTFLRYGVFNLGFICVSAKAYDFVDWWISRTLYSSHRIFKDSVYTDQKWIDLIPAYFRYRILDNPGCNVAPWNIDERPVQNREGKWFIGEKQLVFFHFSQFASSTKKLEFHAKNYLSRAHHSTFPVLNDLLQEYKDALRKPSLITNALNLEGIKESNLTQFAKFSDMTKIINRSGFRIIGLNLFNWRIPRILKKSNTIRSLSVAFGEDLIHLRKKIKFRKKAGSLD